MLTKQSLRIVTGLLTGHCRLTKHLFNMGLADKFNCKFCDDTEETPAHRLGSCPAVLDKRREALGHYVLRFQSEIS